MAARKRTARKAASAANGQRLDAAMSALSDPTRRAVVQALLERPHRPGELATLLAVSPPALSRHLRVLRDSGVLVERIARDDARLRWLSLDPEALTPVRDWLDEAAQMWHEQLAAFRDHAEGRPSRPARRK
jgi:DNA-binding transcriptional ArsR family regulator